MTDKYQRIRDALAMGPTPGPWKAHDQSESGWVDITHSTYATPLCYVVPHSEPLDDPAHDCKLWASRAHETPANAAHVAACDPDTIRALLEERDALDAENEQLRCIISDLKDWDCDVRGGFLSIPVDLRRRMQDALAAHRKGGE